MNRRGLSLVELLVAVAIMGATVVAVGRAYLAGVSYEANFVRDVEDRNARVAFEDDLIRRISEAEIGGTNGYFVAPLVTGGVGGQTNGVLGAGASSMAFTSVPTLPTAYVRSTSSDYEALNSRFGARGGRAETALSLVPVGDAGSQQGLFCREQIPADKEPSRGGREWRMDEPVREIRFEFSDGTQWLPAWDSRDGNQKGKLPVAVRVTYLLAGDPMPHQFLARVALGVSS